MKKMCAVCGDTTVLNVRSVWQRTRDEKCFNVCMMCAEEPNKVTEFSVKEVTKGGFSTVYTEEMKKADAKAFEKRMERQKRECRRLNAEVVRESAKGDVW